MSQSKVKRKRIQATPEFIAEMKGRMRAGMPRNSMEIKLEAMAAGLPGWYFDELWQQTTDEYVRQLELGRSHERAARLAMSMKDWLLADKQPKKPEGAILCAQCQGWREIVLWTHWHLNKLSILSPLKDPDGRPWAPEMREAFEEEVRRRLPSTTCCDIVSWAFMPEAKGVQ